jgi:hypothetical protein
MRLKIFGIPKLLLVLIGLLPAFFWSAFHASSLSIHERTLPTVAITGTLISFIFTYFFSRGFFGIRYGILLFSMITIGDALISSMFDRDFSKLGIALLIFALGMAVSFWLERRVQSADINPKLKWFEGDPKLMPQIEARLKNGDVWSEGKLRAIDRNGFFIFMPESVTIAPSRTFDFELKFKGTEVAGQGKLNAQFIGGTSGFGLQFSPKDLYHFSQYTALVERLKGEGL